MNSLEEVFFWLGAVLCGAALFSGTLAAVFRRPRGIQFAFGFLAATVMALTVVGVSRWVRTGHPPFVSVFESMLTSIWFFLVIFLLIRWRQPKFAAAVVPVSLSVLLLLGWSSALPHEASPLSSALTNVWLFIHASFATCGAATFLIAASLSAVYLIGPERLTARVASAPVVKDQAALPVTVFNFLLFGLILWGVMIASGSVWAHIAWGRYWAWDPIELWSLIAWLGYGLLIHGRSTMRLKPRPFCILTIVAVLGVVFSLWGVQYVYKTIHTYG